MTEAQKPLHERFKKGFKILFRERNPLVSRLGILRALSNMKGSIVDEVRVVTKFEHNNVWLVILDDKAECTELIDKLIYVEENEKKFFGVVSPLNDEHVYRRYKLIWNPYEDKKMIEEYFEKIDKRIELREIVFERCKEEGMQKIYNGNTQVQIRVKKEIRDEIRINEGPIEMEGTKMFLSRVGGPIKCHKCGETGHYASQCTMDENSYKARLMGQREEREEERRRQEYIERKLKVNEERDGEGKVDKENGISLQGREEDGKKGIGKNGKSKGARQEQTEENGNGGQKAT